MRSPKSALRPVLLRMLFSTLELEVLFAEQRTGKCVLIKLFLIKLNIAIHR